MSTANSQCLPVHDLAGPIMVVAPHADDETIGCGGVLARHAASGAHVAAVYVTDTGALRRAEAEDARRQLGITHEFQLGLCEGDVALDGAATDAMARCLTEVRAQTLFVPAFEDLHPDHRRSHRLLAQALGAVEPAARPRAILAYEGFTPITPVNRWADITATAEIKWRALSCFRSQDRLYRLVHICQSLNRYRGLVTMRRSVAFAEAFRAFDLDSYLADERTRLS